MKRLSAAHASWSPQFSTPDRDNPMGRDVARFVMSLSSRLSTLSFWKGGRWQRPSRARSTSSLFCPGRNCSDVAKAGRASVLVDGADYFRHHESSLRQARRSIIIIGRDFDSRIRLRPHASEAESPPLGPLLRALVEAEPHLSVQILIWSISVLHRQSAIVPALFGSDWQQHPRIQLKFDGEHPLYGSHRQQIVCIDGAVALVAGMDLTVRRWDTPNTRPTIRRGPIMTAKRTSLSTMFRWSSMGELRPRYARWPQSVGAARPGICEICADVIL